MELNKLKQNFKFKNLCPLKNFQRFANFPQKVNNGIAKK